MYLNPTYSSLLGGTVLTGQSSSAHLTKLADYASRKDVEHELCADFFALKSLIDFEFDFVTKHHDRYGNMWISLFLACLSSKR